MTRRFVFLILLLQILGHVPPRSAANTVEPSTIVDEDFGFTVTWTDGWTLEDDTVDARVSHSIVLLSDYALVQFLVFRSPEMSNCPPGINPASDGFPSCESALRRVLDQARKLLGFPTEYTMVQDISLGGNHQISRWIRTVNGNGDAYFEGWYPVTLREDELNYRDAVAVRLILIPEAFHYDGMPDGSLEQITFDPEANVGTGSGTGSGTPCPKGEKGWAGLEAALIEYDGLMGEMSLFTHANPYMEQAVYLRWHSTADRMITELASLRVGPGLGDVSSALVASLRDLRAASMVAYNARLPGMNGVMPSDFVHQAQAAPSALRLAEARARIDLACTA